MNEIVNLKIIVSTYLIQQFPQIVDLANINFSGIVFSVLPISFTHQ